MELLRTTHALVLVACAASFCARGQVATESAVKAAFLYKFAGYVEWPAPPVPDAPFVIATLGADDVAGELTAILPGRAVGGRAARRGKCSCGDVSPRAVGRSSVSGGER